MQKIKLNIAAPCAEPWDGMTPTNNGKYCASCQKNVIDFTQYTTDEIADFFSDSKNKNTCGRFYRQQLEQEYVLHNIITAPKYWRAAAGFAATLLLVQTFSACNSTKNTENMPHTPNLWDKYRIESEIWNNSSTIKGRVIDAQTGKSFDHISISVYPQGSKCQNLNNASSTIKTTPNGFFSIQQDSIHLADNLEIYINITDTADEKKEHPFATCVRIAQADFANFHQISIDRQQEQNIAMMSGRVSCRKVK